MRANYRRYPPLTDICRGGIMGTPLQRLCVVEIKKLVMVISVAITVAALFQCFALPYYGKTWSLSPALAGEGSIVMLISNAKKPEPIYVSNVIANDTNYSSNLDDEEDGDDENERKERNIDFGLSSDKEKMDAMLGKGLIIGQTSPLQGENFQNTEADNDLIFGGVQNRVGIVPVVLPGISAKNRENTDPESRTSNSFFPVNETSVDNAASIAEVQSRNNLILTVNKNSTRDSISTLKRWGAQPTSISQMNSLLLQSIVSSQSHHVRPRWSSVRDRELLSAKLKIQNAPFVRNPHGLHTSAFRNASVFKRSYELMERMLRIYIYKEGEKPIFHQSKMRGIYASEGWFMKLLEGNKKFVVRDPRKAHLFYLPFSPQMLRTVLFGKKFQSQKDLEGYLKNYVDLVAQKYSFWNRTGGADHFLVGCHDWASQITRHHMRNCIRVLCNANVAKGFKIGQDATLPVTYIRSVENHIKDLGGRHPSERPILAFFAGGMHGYLRPILLHFWENKESDMKIFGPMPRDIEGKRVYREYMKGSKYCICARGYEVHSPRVVEAILYECVPVIISDNYVPPFFEVLNWEAFSVFVQEKDIPNLRNILLSIPEEKYLAMQNLSDEDVKTFRQRVAEITATL